MATTTYIKKYVFIFLVFVSFIRIIIALTIELGNDEVYYWTYALFPDWSHFDHPPMLGWVIQLFSLNLLFQDEFFLRLGSITFAVITSVLIFKIAKNLWSEKAGFYAVLFYNFSIYFSIITGVFVMPDAPQILFWTLSLYLILKAVINGNNSLVLWILTGLSIGFATISKYHSIYLWIAILGYYVFYDRKNIPFYKIIIAGIVTIIVIFPVLFWNYKNDFISFNFHSERINPEVFRLRMDYFFIELIGQVFYQNPIIFMFIVISIIYIFKRKLHLKKEFGFLLITSLPVIAIFLFISLFRKTLPHWSGPGYVSLILISAYYLSQKTTSYLPKIPIYAGSLFLFIIFSGIAQINFGVFMNEKVDDIPMKKAMHDVTLEMYGWEETGNMFAKYLDQNPQLRNHPIVCYKWFPASHIDYYIAKKTNQDLLLMGNLKDIHKYYWINKKRNRLLPGEDALYLTFTNNFKHPEDNIAYYFKENVLIHKIPITRRDKTVKYCFVYLLKKYKGNYEFNN